MAIVEKVISDTEVYTSESGYGSKAFWNQTRKKGTDGKWGAGADYTFLGFIYNPAVKSDLASSTAIEVGDIVTIVGDAVYYGGTKVVPDWVKKKTWIVRCISKDRVVIDKSVDGKNAICSPIHTKYLKIVQKGKDSADSKGSLPYKVKVTDPALNIRKGAGTDFSVVGCIRDKGIYTIVEEKTGIGASKWGKLQSGAGWIALDYTAKQ